ncbi:MDR family MFS transporter [Corynebacterium felinum]|uniref:EmrB/QacA subfamily drug resistance transporter n=1 Tax=Corynebacterium felinum TaxID=131318 RepID=A0ABU2B9Q9_9CORY|nr:MDR family MFS transporter [Corynebacterium felinum]MDF5821819.1 MDR family MFS transporter [Corynebacterium felinum]MDR7355372.1 EmrB/QacA subfamily drug resistance transporter [Corynebacterium felinum]WJY94724.1 Multidrug resistance protein stp [Corynebacterium felinum]
MNKQQTQVSEKQAWKALAALCIGFFMILLDQTVVAVATPQFQTELGASLNQVVWVSSIYLLFFAVPLLVTGRMGDRFGQRTVYLVGMVIFTLSSLACGLAPSVEWLIVARAVQGLGAAIMTPQTMSVINRIFPREKRGAAMGMWGAVAGLATLIGPILGGVLVAQVGWEWIFFINVPIGVVSLVLVSMWVPTMPQMARSIDFGSIIVSIVAMSALIFAIQQGPELSWPAWIWALLVLGLVLVVVFVKLQSSRGADALVPLAIFSNRNFSLGSFSISMMSFVVAGIMLPIMIFLQEGHGLSAQQAGFMLVPMAVLSGVCAPFVGKLSDRLDPRVLSVAGFSFMLAASVALVVVMREGISFWWILLPVVLLGFGNGFVWSPNSATSLRDLPITQVGAASGVYNTTRQIGSVMGTAVIGAAMQHGIASSQAITTAMGQSLIPAVVVLVMGLAAVSQFRNQAIVRENSHPVKTPAQS